MADKTDAARLSDLKAALQSAAKRGGFLSLNDCAALWGVTKPRFVNKRAEISGFPDAGKVEGNAHFYPERKALRAMIDHLERHKKENAKKATSRAELIGGVSNRTDIASSLSMHTPAELAQLNKLAADVSEREREQGLYVPAADVSAIAGDIFSLISDFMSNLSNRIDPHGALPPSSRSLIDSNAHDKLLELHSKVKGMLIEDVNDRPNRAKNARAGKPRASRGRQAGVRQSA